MNAGFNRIKIWLICKTNQRRAKILHNSCMKSKRADWFTHIMCRKPQTQIYYNNQKLEQIRGQDQLTNKRSEARSVVHAHNPGADPGFSKGEC